MGQRRGPRRQRVDRVLFRLQQRRIGKRDGLRIRRRYDHPHPHRRLVEHLFGEIERHAHATVRGGVAGQRPAMQRNAVPGDAQHVRHPGVVIHGRVVILVFLDDGEHAGRRLASGGAGRDRRAQDPAVGVVEGHVLTLDRHDRHDRVARRARRRHYGLARRGGVLGGGGRHRGKRRQRRQDGHNSGCPPAQCSGACAKTRTASRCGSRLHHWLGHSIPRSKRDFPETIRRLTLKCSHMVTVPAACRQPALIPAQPPQPPKSSASAGQSPARSRPRRCCRTPSRCWCRNKCPPGRGRRRPWPDAVR